MNFAAVIPCLNEARTIEGVVRKLKQHLKTVYVVDDGSNDNSVELAQAAGAAIIRHPENRGKGAALQSGFLAALEAGFSFAVTLDADGQHDPGDLPALLEAAERGASLVIGNRMLDTAAMPLIRRIVNLWMSRRISALAKIPIPDSQCGYRAIDLKAWSSFEFRCTHFDFESELLLQFARSGKRLAFVPVATVYGGEQSKISPIHDSLRWFRWWIAVQKEMRGIESTTIFSPRSTRQFSS